MDGCDQLMEQMDDSPPDSVSLLYDFVGGRGSAEFIEISDLDLQAQQKQDHSYALDPQKPPDPPEPRVCSRTGAAAGGAKRTSQTEDAPQSVKLPKNIHQRDKWGETILHKACKKGDLQMVRALLQAGVEVNTVDNAGWTALHEAAMEGDKAVVEELLKAGASVSPRSFESSTPLHDAVSLGHYEAVKLLLQFGANVSDCLLDGTSTLDMAKDDNMKQLLQTFRPTSGVLQEEREESSRQTRPGHKSSETRCHKQLCSQSVGPNQRPGVSGDRDGAREPADIQRRTSHANIQTLTHSVDLTSVLEEVRTKQTEISFWTLTQPQDAVRYQEALTQIQNQLMEVLEKQRQEKDGIARKKQTMSSSLWQCVMKPRLQSLATCQKNLVELLQRQKQLEEVCVTMKAKLSVRPPEHLQKKVNAQSKRSQGWSTPSASVQTMAPSPQHVSLQITGRNPVAQMRADDHSGRLSELALGILRPGCNLNLLSEGQLGQALVLADRSLQDDKGRVHLSPERWLESVFGSSTYTWDKVTFSGTSHSSDLHTETNRRSTQHCRHSSSSAVDGLTPEEASLQRLMGIKTIRLVDDEELLPNAIMDYYWEKLLQDDCSDSEWT